MTEMTADLEDIVANFLGTEIEEGADTLGTATTAVFVGYARFPRVSLADRSALSSNTLWIADLRCYNDHQVNHHCLCFVLRIVQVVLPTWERRRRDSGAESTAQEHLPTFLSREELTK